MNLTFLLLTMSSLALSAPLGTTKGAPWIPLINFTIFSNPNFGGTSHPYSVDLDTCSRVNVLEAGSIEVAHSNHCSFFSTTYCEGQVIYIGNEDGSADRQGDLIKLLAQGEHVDEPEGFTVAGNVNINSVKCSYTPERDPSHIV